MAWCHGMVLQVSWHGAPGVMAWCHGMVSWHGAPGVTACVLHCSRPLPCVGILCGHVDVSVLANWCLSVGVL